VILAHILLIIKCVFFRTWLKKSCDEARLRQGASAPVREEALRRSENLAKALHLKEVKWDCGWSNAHFIGCIQSLHTLTQDHPDLLSVLKGNIFLLYKYQFSSDYSAIFLIF